jgi:iron complex outermembrane recepter protein
LQSPNNPFADANIFATPGDHIPAIRNQRVKL